MGKIISCPKCGSTQISANKNGFSGKKALLGDIIAGPVGLLAGTFGSSKVVITCLACGHRFKPGDGRVSSNPSSYNTTQTDSPISKTQPGKSKGHGCLVIIIAILLIGFISDKLGCDKTDESTQNTSIQNKVSSISLTKDDSIKIYSELTNVLKVINNTNIAPLKAMKQFSKYAAGLNNSSSNISQVFQAAKIAKHKMEIAGSEISNITTSDILPQKIKESLSSDLSTITSSYFTLSQAFDEAMEEANNPSDNSYVEAFRNDMEQGTEMYGQALEDILKTQSAFNNIPNKRKHN